MYENEQKLEAVFLHGRKLETGFASDHLWGQSQTRQGNATRFLRYVRSPTNRWQAMVSSPLHQEIEPRAHYWYFVIADCSLEYQYRDGSIPKLHFTINMWNDVSGASTKDWENGGLRP
jgi:hypothetical protein